MLSFFASCESFRCRIFGLAWCNDWKEISGVQINAISQYIFSSTNMKGFWNEDTFFYPICSSNSSNFSNGLRIIKLYNLNSNSVSNIEEVKNVVYDCEYKDSSNFGYSTYYHAIGELIVRDLRTYNSYNGYFSSFIFCFCLYPELESIFTDGIFWI